MLLRHKILLVVAVIAMAVYVVGGGPITFNALVAFFFGVGLIFFFSHLYSVRRQAEEELGNFEEEEI
jgi:hypothetical protein